METMQSRSSLPEYHWEQLGNRVGEEEGVQPDPAPQHPLVHLRRRYPNKLCKDDFAMVSAFLHGKISLYWRCAAHLKNVRSLPENPRLISKSPHFFCPFYVSHCWNLPLIVYIFCRNRDFVLQRSWLQTSQESHLLPKMEGITRRAQNSFSYMLALFLIDKNI